MKDWTNKRARKNLGKRGKKRPVHGKSLEHIRNAIVRKARDARNARGT